jgi:ABC-type polar amino acid transport system ATPase subunit
MIVDPLIELTDVNKFYGKWQVLRDIGLSVMCRSSPW